MRDINKIYLQTNAKVLLEVVQRYIWPNKNQILMWRAAMVLETKGYKNSDQLLPTRADCGCFGLDEFGCDFDVIVWDRSVAQLRRQCDYPRMAAHDISAENISHFSGKLVDIKTEIFRAF